MNGTFNIIALQEIGDGVRITAQGEFAGDAFYQTCCRKLELTVPSHIGRRYKVGQHLDLGLTPKRKR